MSDSTSSPDPIAARERDRRHVWHPWSPLAADRTRVMLSHGDGYRVWDVDGKEFIDASSLNSTCGYAHPDVVDAIDRQLRRFHGIDLSVASHEPVGLLAERLASYLPATMSKSLFVNSGSEGLEAAVLIASSYWAQRGEPRSRVVAFARGYHGSTLLSRSLSGLPRVGHDFNPAFAVTHVELPAAPAVRQPDALPGVIARFERAIEDGDPPSAVVVEPFLNVGGGVVLPDGFLRALRDLCDATGTLLVLDEVFTAFGRLGRMFAFERDGVEPDIVVSSKGLASGYFPIAAVTVQDRIYESFRDEPVIGGLRYGHTTSGHAVACAAALATLDVIEKEQLLARAETAGAALLERLSAVAAMPGVVDVRGVGLVGVVEMESYDVSSRVVEGAYQAGLLLRQPGEAVMIVPPLTIDDPGIEAVATRIEAAVAGAAS